MKKLLIICSIIFNGILHAQYAGNGVFERIYSTNDLTNGYYVITAGTSKAMSNTFGGLYFSPTSFTEVGNSIINPPTSIVWKIETNETFRTIKSESLSKFVSYAGIANDMQFVDDVISNNQKWNITDNSSIFFITNAVSTNQRLSFYPEFSRWACYPGTQIHPRLYKLNTTLAIESFKENNFSIYPNPTTTVINIQKNTNLTIDSIVIYDVTGKKVIEENTNFNQINIQNISSGVYSLKIIADGKSTTYKFLKQ